MTSIYIAILGLITLSNATKTGDVFVDKDACSTCTCTNITVAGILELQLNCSGRSLSSIDNITFPDNVSILLLSNNAFTRIENFQFSHFRNLKELDLSNNKIEHLENHSFSNLTTLQSLSLANNRIIASYYTNDVFKDLHKLRLLKLNNNSISNYPDEALSRLASLETLFINGAYDVDFGQGFRSLKNLKNLTLSGSYGHCNITNLTKLTFENVLYLEYLDISFCYISYIEGETFSPLTHLQTLDLSRNYRLLFTGFSTGAVGLDKTNITTLMLNNIVHWYASCVIIQKKHITHLSNTSLRNLYVDDNAIETIVSGVLDLLPKTLTFISAQRNKFTYGKYVHELHTLTGLRRIKLSGKSYPIYVSPMMGHFTTPERCGNDRDEDDMDINLPIHFDHWPSDWRNDNAMKHHDTFNILLPPYLQSIECNFTQMILYIGDIQFDAPSLKHLDLSSNLIKFQYGTLRGLENVTYLDLANNLAKFMSLDLLFNCVHLQTLNISYNFFGLQIMNDTEGKFFRNLSELNELVMSNTVLQTLKGDVLKDLHSLKQLIISNNGMYAFMPSLKNMPHLQLINCSYNRIQWLNANTMLDLSQIKKISRNFTLDLRANPLSCTCRGLETLTWLLKSGVTPDDMSGYFCIFPNKSPRYITDSNDFRMLIDHLKNDCQNNFGLAMGSVAIFIAMSGLLVLAVLYRFRWKLRYFYYAARSRYKTSTHLEDEEEFVFDAFVSYADEDRGFVINDMRTRLEQEGQKTLNIHHRDFMPGEPIASNIVGAIKSSRKTLVVFSQKFLDSYWCMYEIQMAMMESISTGRDIIIIIMYESVPAKKIPPEFLHLMQSDSYIEYPDTEENKDIFWRHLTRAIQHTRTP